jgi:signal transduction histidine kinase
MVTEDVVKSPARRLGEEVRVLVVPPTTRDGAAMQKVLRSAGMDCHICRVMKELCEELTRGVGVVILSEESLAADADPLLAHVRQQPVWSDLPIVVLSRTGGESLAIGSVMARLGAVSVLERPVRINTLVSVSRTALQARERQYQVRDHLAELASARLEAERASRMKDEFLATLSHELRTPLNAILGWTQILKKNPGDVNDMQEGLEVIERNSRAQTQIIEDLLDMSRIISGKVALTVQRLDLASVLRTALETVKPAAQAKGIRLRPELESRGVLVSGDINRLQQVFWNLLSNAVKFTPRGGQVQVILERVESQVEVSVIDSGEGIESQFIPHVFDRFRQADASTTRRHGGLGLGLSIVKQLVELHGGTVRVKSPGAGKGSTFVVSLPLTIVHAEAAPMPLRRHPTAAATEVSLDACESIEGVRVLVVDDEPDARQLLERLLKDCKAVVSTAGSVEQAIERLQTDRPSLLISDIGMPGEDGYSLIRRVRALGAEKGGAIPAIALTAYARAEDRVKAVVAGYQMHLAKPVEPAELIAMVSSLAKKGIAQS